MVIHILKTFVKQINNIANIYFVFLLVFIGVFTYFGDAKRFKNLGLDKETKIAKVIGVIYMIIGPVLFGLSKLIK
ncbi:hypothetical protein PV797_21425 [Clostridiaceae bacterium M8S5]|nr:hypothetical protein PV797_21425 [Clostridiaceae bacterium M8S5]